MSDGFIAVFATAVGFVSAGILASFYQLVTADPVRFDMRDDRLLLGVGQILLLMFAGPAVLMRNAVRGRVIEKRPLGWLAAAAVIAAGWSLCSGIVVLEFALAIRASV